MAPAHEGSHGLRKSRGWIVLVVAGVFAPLWGFWTLVDGLRQGQAFAFDVPVLQAVHSIANAHLDRMFLAITALGYGWGVIPADAILVLGLALARRTREAVFASVSILGSLALDFLVKHSFERARPSLWDSLLHEDSYSFPSGHAMASMTLAWIVVLLCWSARPPLPRRLRWSVTVAAAVCVALVGLSRIYLGLHYPSDILAGWAAASSWVVSVYAVMFHRRRSSIA